jgi:hypothetical protein
MARVAVATVLRLLTVSLDELVTVYVPVASMTALFLDPGIPDGVQFDAVPKSPLTPFAQ